MTIFQCHRLMNDDVNDDANDDVDDDDMNYFWTN
jgi:hypothetical protein